MKKALFSIMVMAVVSAFVSGCFTSATAFTKKTAPDGTVTESKVKIIGTGDKASQIAADGLFADGASDDLGAGVKTASASQQSTGIRETLEGMGVLLTGIGSLVARTQGVPVAAAVAGLTDTAPEAMADTGDIEYSANGYGGVPGANGVGVYGKPSCSRCRAYVAAHPDAQIIDVRVAANNAALWTALKSRGYSGASVGLPVVVTEAGYTQAAK